MILNEEATNFIIELVAEHYDISNRNGVALKPLTTAMKDKCVAKAVSVIEHGVWEIVYNAASNVIYFDRKKVKEL